MSAHLGHRENPIRCLAPGDLDRAVLRVWHPTEAQASAGNYKMAHALIDGLPVTIETPLDRFRTGTSPNGVPWKVQMTAHYGYVKGTEGADGDHVDVYVGPEAHRAHVLPVWVVDQCDADTREFDEHKVLIGFETGAEAKKTYLAAFSDGRGPERIGGVGRISWAGFRSWLNSDQTKNPSVMKKSASVQTKAASYGPVSTCGCAKCNGTVGGYMPEAVAKSETTPTGLGRLTSMIAKGFSGLSGTQQAEVLAEAALMAKSEVSKASEALTHHGEMEHLHQFEDQWDGPPDDKLETVEAHGPGSSAPPGKVNVGPNEAASGNGAEKMEREYSTQKTPQKGVQRATEQLGEAIMGIRGTRKAIASLVKAMEMQSLQIDLMKAQSATVNVPDAAAIQKMIDGAVSKAMTGVSAMITKAVSKALAKADDEKDDEKDDDKESEVFKAEGEEEADDEDEEADEEESGSGVEIEIDNDVEDDDEDEDEAAKSLIAQAARFRQMAKGRIKWANRRMSKAVELHEGNRPKSAAITAGKARYNLRKATSYLDAAKALRPDATGAGTKRLMKALAKAKGKAMSPEVKMQTVWPNKGEHAAKAEPNTPDTASVKALGEAIEKMNKAASGVGLLQTSVAGLMESMMGQSRNPQLPPALNLAMAKGETVDAALVALADSNVISMDDLDDARNVIRLARTPNVPPTMLEQKIGMLPEPARRVFAQAAA